MAMSSSALASALRAARRAARGGGPREGAAYVFERGPAGWAEVQKLVAPDTLENDSFGWAIAIDGETVAANKIISLDKPAGNAIDKEGKLYVTTFGTQEDGSEKSPGELIIIPGEF